MIYPPLLSVLMLFFLALTLVFLPLLWFEVVGTAFANLGLSRGMVFWLLILSLLGSMVNLPLTTLKSEAVTPPQVVTYFGMRVRLPPVRVPRHTVLAVNVGGALIPVGLSVYLLVKIIGQMGLPFGLVVTVAVVTGVMYAVARPIPGLGIGVPGLLPPVLAALGAWLLCPEAVRAPCAYIASTLGVLIGADLLNLGKIPRLGAPVASIGGAGTFDAIFLGGILSVLLSN
uniref:DUF1614 domain-containing protein n=1 Tax=Desulfobacca acetoxidans TaxID=60893 RepID=A0A7V4LCJ7_9BACT